MRHQHISFIKSGIRILGYFLLGLSSAGVTLLLYAGIVLIVSEALGIVEEIGHE